MSKTGNRSIPAILVERLFGLALFLFFLYLANHIGFFTQHPQFSLIIGFLNTNIWLIILMSFAFLFGEVFNALVFPLNLPAPLFNAGGGVLLVAFLLRIFSLIDVLINENIFQVFNQIAFLLYSLVFILVLVGGYISILVKLSKDTDYKTGSKQGCAQEAGRDNITWEEVHDEFKTAINDLLILIRQSINKRTR